MKIPADIVLLADTLTNPGCKHPTIDIPHRLLSWLPDFQLSCHCWLWIVKDIINIPIRYSYELCWINQLRIIQPDPVSLPTFLITSFRCFRIFCLPSHFSAKRFVIRVHRLLSVQPHEPKTFVWLTALFYFHLWIIATYCRGITNSPRYLPFQINF